MTPNKTVLVTGANGMLATNIIEKLAQAGYKVIGTVRKGKKYGGEVYENITTVEADYKDPSAMDSLMAGCDTVFHVAAMTSQSEKNYEVFRKVNVEATRMLLETAVKNGTGTFVYVSTANAIGFGAAEDRPMCYPFSESLYARSKKEAEDIVKTYSGKLRTVIVNPTFMIGKYGTKKGSNRVFDMVRNSPLIFCPKGGKNVIDVEEAARGMVLAMEKAKTGSQYLICGENFSYKEMFRKIAAHYGVRRLYVTVPNWLLKTAGHAGDFLAKCGIPSEVSSTNMDILMIDNFYFTDKAGREIGFEPKGLFE